MQLNTKKHQKIVIMALLFGIVVSFIYLKYRQPPSQPTPENITEPLNKEAISVLQNPESQTSTFQKKNLPNRINTYPIYNRPLDEPFVLSLIESFGYKDPIIQNGAYIIDDFPNKKSILINTKTNTLIYDIPLKFSAAWKDEQFHQAALNRFSSLFRNQAIWESPKFFIERKPSEGSHEGPIIVHFFPTLDGYRIVSSARTPIGDFGIAKATFHPESESLTINYEFIETDTSQPTTIALKNQSVLENDISSGNTITTAIYPSSNQVAKYYETPHVPQNAVYIEYELMYLYDSSKLESNLRPIFLASGKAVLSNGEDSTIKTLINAATQE